MDKPIYWVGSSREDLTNLPKQARRQVGFELRAIQKGQAPTDFKPISTVGQGVEEIRLRSGGAYRVFYVARFEEAVYVLHVFEKKAQKTSKQDLELGRQRYQEMRRFRQQREKRDHD